MKYIKEIMINDKIHEIHYFLWTTLLDYKLYKVFNPKIGTRMLQVQLARKTNNEIKK